MLNLATLLEASVKEHPHRPAIVMGDRRLSYAELNGAANQFANGLRAIGIQRGDKVALMLPNVPYFPIAYYGILKAGAVVVPLNVLLKGREVEYHLNDSDAVAVAAFEMFTEEAYKGFQNLPACRTLIIASANPATPPPIQDERVTTLGRVMYRQPPTFDTVQTMPDDTAVILYTSGTTGQPKGAELSHFNMFYNAQFAADKLVGITPDDVLLGVLPLFHSFGQTCTMNAGLSAGATVVLLPRFEPDTALGAMQQAGVTLFAGVPTMYWAMLNVPEVAQRFDVPKIAEKLRLCLSGGAAMPVELMRAFEEQFGVMILEGYGLSETSPVASFNVRDKPRKPGSIGVPIWGTEMKIFDDNDQPLDAGERGEIVIRGHNVMKGYYKKPEATAETMRHDWFHSGDIAYQDEDGYFFIVDRKKDMINRGGFNVYPRELEEVLMTHPAVSLVAVIGVPDEKLGEEVKAIVVRQASDPTTEDELLEWCKEQFAAYKRPRYLEFRESLPMTATGKILKRELS
ncbi:MAG: long-chain fatty acid--CoA ligase [Ardenticatenaceae bacterium]|nr:long-chain fatty acid--CoA ligase [Ardenticatenaceae bacterium]HBY94723.1 long-chain-fatty-acid--CoA ligase [Chloroflexota bacterium]